MRKVFRYEDNKEYWDRRWGETVRDPDRFTDLNIYPIKYANMVVKRLDQRTLELGAGLGRVLKHYHYAGYNIVGLERSEVAVQRLKGEDSGIHIQVGDALKLPFEDQEFDVILAFGVFHNLEEGIELALAETTRCLKMGGSFCISMRPDNVEMRLNEWYWCLRQRGPRRGTPKFHKWLVGERVFIEKLLSVGLHTDCLYRARNVSILYRIPWLRDRSGSEMERRGKGYRLSRVGGTIDRLLVGLFPRQFCNVLVFIGHRGA